MLQREFSIEEIEQSIPDRFEKQVTRYPKRVAISTGEKELNYRDLNEFSNRIARTLITHRGTTPEPVTVFFHQGINAIAAILGVLKAGKFYVPLDPGHPLDRITRMLTSSETKIVVTEELHLSVAQKLGDETTQIINVERLDDQLPNDNLELSVCPEALAYIFFTSGSTGVPKGVMDTHRNVLHNVMRYTNSLHFRKEDRLSLLQSCSFSGTVSSLFGALLNGACVVPIDLRTETSRSFADWLQSQKVTIYHSVPAIFRNLIQDDSERFPHVRVVRLEGDRASRVDVELFRNHFGRQCILVNGLGTTETGLVSQYFIDQDTPIPIAVVPVGFPVEDMGVVLLDESGETVPANTVGEIAVRSPFLALGYWQRPDLTSQVFFKDPSRTEQRIYKTGDLGREQADGCLEVLGRKDSRVKIRGQTVELTEVEAALLKLGSIQQVVVVEKADSRTELRLIAYLVPTHATAPSVTQLRDHLKELLPAFMIPAVFVTLEILPLDANGKVDRNALPSPPSARPNLDSPYAQPVTSSQRELVAIWEDLLGINPIGINDDFFALGGDSLLAFRMIHRVAGVFGTDIQISQLLTKTSIELLSQVISEHSIYHLTPLIEVPHDNSKSPFFFLHGDYLDGGWYCRRLAQGLGKDRSVYAVPPSGLDGGPVLDTYEAMASYHLEKLKSIQPNGPYLLGGHCNGGLVALEIARLLDLLGEKVELLVLSGASAKNVRFRRVHAAINRLSSLPGIDPELWVRLYLLAQSSIEFLDNRSGFELARHILRIAGKIPGYLSELWRSTDDQHQNKRHLFEEESAVGDPDERRAARKAFYQRIDKLYMPEPYAGRLTLLWPDQDPDSPTEAEKLWREVCPHVEIRVIPGTHETCRTTYADEFSSELQACLDDVSGT